MDTRFSLLIQGQYKVHDVKFMEQLQQRSGRGGNSAMKDTLNRFNIFFLNTSSFLWCIFKAKIN